MKNLISYSAHSALVSLTKQLQTRLDAHIPDVQMDFDVLGQLLLEPLRIEEALQNELILSFLSLTPSE